LKEGSKIFKDRAEKLKLQLLWKKYMIYIIIAALILIFLGFKFVF